MAYPQQVIVQQPGTINVEIMRPQEREWSSGLCACFDDCGSCCLGCLCPCCLLSGIASRQGEHCCFTTCCPGALLGLRIKLRVEQNIKGSLCNDYCVVSCCPLLVMCQLSRELKDACMDCWAGQIRHIYLQECLNIRTVTSITMQEQQQQIVTTQPVPPQGHVNAGFPVQAYPQPIPVQQTSTNTVVMINQPVTVPLAQPREWSSGLCGCFEDFNSCLLGCFCPLFLLIDISNRLGESCCFPYCCPGALLGLRIAVRVEQNIKGSLCNDYCVVSCCPFLVMCQLSRELKHVGR